MPDAQAHGNLKAMKLLSLTATILLFAGFLTFLNFSLKKNEAVECHTWQSQSREYPQFFLASWQAEQCNALGIVVNAPIAYARK